MNSSAVCSDIFINRELKMYHRVVLGAALLTCCTSESSVHGLPGKVQAFVGGNIILPCSFKTSADDDLPSVEWSKEGLQPNVVFLYRHGCETYEMKNPAFEFRTSLITTELKNRNFSLRISNVQLSDAGTYRCMKLSATRIYTEVELIVGAVSEPKLSFTSSESGGVTLQCEAICGLPEPEITFLDDEGNYLPADEPRRDQEDGGCYSVTRRLTIQGATKRVTCRVHQPEINQTRTTETYIPVDCIRSSSLTTVMAVGGTMSLLLNLFGFAALLRNKFQKSDVHKVHVSRKSSDTSSPNKSYVNQLLLSVDVDGDPNVGNNNEKKISREEGDLESKTFHRAETNPNTQLLSLHGTLMWSSVPKSGFRIPQSRINSIPDASKTSESSSSPPEKRVSFDNKSITQYRPNGLNLKRRHSSAVLYPVSVRSHPSQELPEETLTSL